MIKYLLQLIVVVVHVSWLVSGFQCRSCNKRQQVELHQRLKSHQNIPMERLIVIGCGNVANALFSELQHNMIFKETICASRRSRNELETVFENVQYISSQQVSKVISECSHILVTVPPIQSNDHYLDVLLDNREMVSAIRTGTKVSYVSTTGVYGDHEYGWVDESSPTLCSTESNPSHYLYLENRYQNCFGVKNTSIFRCAGLYGYDFSALHTVLKRGGIQSLDQMSKEDVTSRVHLNDVARSILASMVQDQSGIFNLADDEPASRKMVMEYAYNLLVSEGISLPSVDTQCFNAPISERSSRRIKDRKRVKNTKMKTLLAGCGGLNFPSYKEGLKSVLDHNIDNWRK